MAARNVLSLSEKGARLFVTRFFSRYISTGSLTWGEIFTFEGTISNSFQRKVVLKVHSPKFYWKVIREADLGLANAYINGDFSLMDKEEGLLNLILREDEDLKTAQLRKICVLIKKARINKKHNLGCGWGILAIEIVKQTGCHSTAITLSQQQLQYAQKRVQHLGLQDHIEFLLCDYRELSNTTKYDRILSCEMIEAVGHEFMEDFFGTCESVITTAMTSASKALCGALGKYLNSLLSNIEVLEKEFLEQSK
ncbi:ufaA1, partial [Cucurbita argyrosperma subsp. argyrosperma]